jgi:hypothetical protein
MPGGKDIVACRALQELQFVGTCRVGLSADCVAFIYGEKRAADFAERLISRMLCFARQELRLAPARIRPTREIVRRILTEFKSRTTRRLFSPPTERELEAKHAAAARVAYRLASVGYGPATGPRHYWHYYMGLASPSNYSYMVPPYDCIYQTGRMSLESIRAACPVSRYHTGRYVWQLRASMRNT